MSEIRLPNDTVNWAAGHNRRRDDLRQVPGVSGRQVDRMAEAVVDLVIAGIAKG
jgi:hypothetical protein